VQNDGFALMLVGPKHLINKIGLSSSSGVA